MKLLHFFAAAAAVGVVSFASSGVAYAGDAGGPCGNFNFTSGLACKIEVSGGCTASCTPLNFEVGCSGGCQVLPDPACSNPCETTCSATCAPTTIDCLSGCHGECDQQLTTTCQQQDPTADCVTQAKAQCDTHCNSSCSTPSTNCAQVCTCCDGSCSAQINFQCDFQCFARLQGGCTTQCNDPSGAIFCNGQYVEASDVQACISYLATQGINLDASPTRSAHSGPNGCQASGKASVGGCAVTAATANASTGGLGIVGLLVGTAMVRSARRRARK